MELDYYTDDEDFNELVNLVAHPRRPRIFRQRIDHFEVWNDEEFHRRFRLTKHTTQILINEIGLEVGSLTNRNHAISPAEKILATLRFLATGSILQVLGDFSGFDKSSASRVIHQCLTAIAGLRPYFIKMPTTEEEIASTRQGFFNKCKFPRCIGALDCTHIKIQSPGGPDAEIFRNRKGYFSMNVQGICDSELRFRNIVCRWPGSTADSTIFNNSRIRRDMELHNYGDSVLVGDSGYNLKNYLMIPLPEPHTPAELLYNESQIRTRNPIERCFGIWKRRSPILALGIKLCVTKVEEVVVASGVLHNLAIFMKDELPDEVVNEELEAAINLGNIPIVNNRVGIPRDGFVQNMLINGYFHSLL